MPPLARPDRRALIAAGLGLAGLAALPPVAAAPAPVPALDSLTLTVLDDKETFGPFLPDRELGGLSVRYAGNGGPPAPRMRARALEAEFGLSLLCQSQIGADTRRILVDFGYSPEVLANNLALLGIDAAAIDAAVLSHGHLDHYGGFPALAEALATRSGRPLPLHVGGEETFCDRVAMIGTPPPRMGALDRAALAKAGFDVRITPRPAPIADHGLLSGTIPLDSFERAAIPTLMHPGVGCDRALLSPDKRGADELPDDGEHELAMSFVVRGRGLVVISCCSHRGILNAVRQAQALTGERRIHMVIGGFHLVRPRTEEEARRTVAELAALDPAYVVPMHCTGETFVNEALRVMPAKLVRPYVGMRLTIGAV